MITALALCVHLMHAGAAKDCRQIDAGTATFYDIDVDRAAVIHHTIPGVVVVDIDGYSGTGTTDWFIGFVRSQCDSLLMLNANEDLYLDLLRRSSTKKEELDRIYVDIQIDKWYQLWHEREYRLRVKLSFNYEVCH